MIELESDVFSAVAIPIREKHGASVSGEYVDKPSKFPAVTVLQINSSVIPRMRTLNMENAAAVAFEINVYDNTAGGYKKQNVKKIMADVDEIMAGLGFERKMCSPTPDIADASIYRMTARYEAAVDTDLFTYQN